MNDQTNRTKILLPAPLNGAIHIHHAPPKLSLARKRHRLLWALLLGAAVGAVVPLPQIAHTTPSVRSSR